MIESFVTKEMIYELARHNPVVRQHMMLVEHSKLDYTSALAACVYYLAKESDEKTKMLLKHLEVCISPTPIMKGDL